MSQSRYGVTTTTDRDIVTERLIDAPREQVFRAWTDPEHLARWWGPRGARTTISKFDLRPGGAWRYVMHGADGTHYRHEIAFAEIVPPGRLVLKHVSSPLFEVTVTFADEGGKTRLTWCTRFASDVEFDRGTRFAVEEMVQNLDRLEAALPAMV